MKPISSHEIKLIKIHMHSFAFLIGRKNKILQLGTESM